MAGYIADWCRCRCRPWRRAFARQVVAAAAPATRARANALLWAAARLAAVAIPLGSDPVPEVLHPSVIERFAAGAPGWVGAVAADAAHESAAIGPGGGTALDPGGRVVAPRARQGQYSPAEVDVYLALADAQPTVARRMRTAGLVCLGAGAGLSGADLRHHELANSPVTCEDVVADLSPVSEMPGHSGPKRMGKDMGSVTTG